MRRACDRRVGVEITGVGRSAFGDNVPAELGRRAADASTRTEFVRLCNLRGEDGFARGKNDSLIGNREIGSRVGLDLTPESTEDLRLLTVRVGDVGEVDSDFVPEAAFGEQRILVHEGHETMG